jgi:hypothetical protein
VPIPESVTDKIFRSKQHLDALGLELGRYFKTNPGKIVRQAEGDPSQYIGKFELNTPLPRDILMIIGDATQNLRSSLDYLVRELVLAAKNQPSDREMFPICDSLKSFKHAIRRGQLLGVPEEAVALIESLQPYHLGEHWEKHALWVLNQFANINKHRRVLITKPFATSNVSLETKVVNGELWAKGDIPIFDEDTRIGPFAMHEGREVKVNSQVIICVTINEGPVKGMEVGKCLVLIFNFVGEKIIPEFNRFFG